MPLSERQKQIMKHLIVDGMTAKEIGAVMGGISKSTVTKHFQKIRKKLGAKSMYQAVGYLVGAGIIEIDGQNSPVPP